VCLPPFANSYSNSCRRQNQPTSLIACATRNRWKAIDGQLKVTAAATRAQEGVDSSVRQPACRNRRHLTSRRSAA
jgi:hypothetical protein